MPPTGGFLDAADWSVIAVYLLGIVGLGVWLGQGQRTTRDYFLGGKSVPWWGIGLSIVAAETSALTIISVPAIAYGGNLLFLQMLLGYVIARVVLAIFLVPHYFEGEIYSPYELFARAFGPSARQAAGGLFLLGETLAAGVRVYVACIPVQLMLGLQVLPAIVLFVVLSLIYTYLGGVRSVIWTDAVQFGLFLFGGLFTVLYVPWLLPGGWAGAVREAAGAGKLLWLSTHGAVLREAGLGRFLAACLAEPFNLWMGLIGGTVMVLSSHGADQLIVQRVLACKGVAEGRKALVLSAVAIFPLFLVFLAAGVMLWVYYQHFPFAIPIPGPAPGVRQHDYVYPIFMLTAVPHWLRGFLIVAILAAAMSSASSALTALASVSTMDFVRHWGRAWSEEACLRFSRHSTVLWAGAVVVVAYLSRQTPFVLNTAFSLRGLTSGALLGGLILAVFRPRGRALPVVAGMAVSVIALAGLDLLPRWGWSSGWWRSVVGVRVFWPWFTLIGTVITVGVVWVVAVLGGAPHSRPAPTAPTQAPRDPAQAN